MADVRGHRQGTIFPRTPHFVAAVQMPDGKRPTRACPHVHTPAELTRRRECPESRALLDELLRLRDLELIDPRRLRLGAYLARWVSSMTGLAPATMRQHAMIVDRHLVPALGARRLVALSPAHVDAYLAAKRLDPQTLRHHRSTLRRALADAVRDGLVTRNAAALSRPPRMHKAERRYLTAPEVRRVIDETQDERLWPLWTLIVTTGLRVSEALGLRWSDVDWQAQTVTVARTLQYVGEWRFEEPKSRKSRRTIPLIPDALDALREQQARQEGEAGVRLIAGLVFYTDAGRPIHSSNVLPQWYRALRRIGLPKVTIHDLRHSCATLLLGAGVPLPVIADILGHSTVRVTADLYAHVIPELRRDAADRLARALS